jgi:pyruvate dehydrogenase E2 component (dihydrolipoamide acetyltransferase)
MAYEVKLPRLGWDMEDGSLAAWLKQDGEFVTAGEFLFSIEGDKAVQEIEALDSGFLYIPPASPKMGEKVPVGTLLGYLVPEEEKASFHIPGNSAPEEPVSPEPQAVAPVQETQILSEGAKPDNRTGQRIYISPYARRLAQSLGVEWQKVQGSGFRGRIMAKDVESAVRIQEPAKPAAPAPQIVRIPMPSMRKKIAEHMAASAHTTAPVTLTCEVDATEIVALRKTLKEDFTASGLPVPSYNDLLAKLSAQALLEHPMMNARLDGNEIVQSPTVNIAIAVDTERGLIVPVLRDVQTKGLRQIARETTAMIEKTRTGAISYDDLQGATFTITNLGMFEIDAFTPIIDMPQCAILGVGRIIPKQVVVDVESAQVAIRHMMFLSLTFDHRLVDGAQAARFLQRVKRFIDKPYLWLAG